MERKVRMEKLVGARDCEEKAEYQNLKLSLQCIEHALFKLGVTSGLINFGALSVTSWWTDSKDTYIPAPIILYLSFHAYRLIFSTKWSQLKHDLYLFPPQTLLFISHGTLLTILMQLPVTYKILRSFHQTSFVVSLSRFYSHLIWWLTQIKVPVCLRRPIYGLYAYLNKIDMAEAEFDFASYPKFNDFFTRRLKKGARVISLADDRTSICSPSDGAIFATGKVDSAHSLIDCVKGHSYRLDQYLFGVIGDQDNKFPDYEKLSMKPNNNTDLNRLLS